jgi:hypothetical protein
LAVRRARSKHPQHGAEQASWYARRAGISALVLALGVGGVIVLVNQLGDPATDVHGRPGTTWLSGEKRGRVVLAAAGGDVASVGVKLSEAESAYDVADTGSTVYVHDRSAGELLLLDGRDGTLSDRRDAAVGTEDNRSLVEAGEVAYFVDSAAGTAQRLDGNGSSQPPVAVEGATAWVGSNDGRLWLIDQADGEFGTFDGRAVTWSKFAESGADLEITAVGTDPVVLDRSTGRLRWLRRGLTSELDGADQAVLQRPAAEGSCVHVVVDATASCISPDGARRELTLAASVDPGALLFGNQRNLAVLWPGRAEVVLGSWETMESTTAERRDPSGRVATAWSSPGPLLIDDPGSQFALTTDRNRVIEMDKFNRRTVLVDPEGDQLENEDETDVEVEAAGQGGEDDPADPLEDTDGVNDPPQPQPDEVVTRSGRSVAIEVLANDIDPDGDVLAVLAAGPANEGQVVVADGSRVTYTSSLGFTGNVQFPYTVVDPGNLQAAANVTVTVKGLDENTDPVLANDEWDTLEGLAVDIPVLRNDRDPEGDPLTVTTVSAASNGTAAPTGDGRVRYQPRFGFVGIDTFTYVANDEFGGSAQATVRVNVNSATGVNTPPNPISDRAQSAAGERVRVPVLANDSDAEGDSLRVVDVSQVGGATATIVLGQFVDIVPGASYSGPLTFTYTVEDGRGLRASARIIVLVQPASGNRAPNAIDDRLTNASTAQVYDIVANDADPDNDSLTIVSVTQPAEGGSVVKVSGTAIEFTPSANFIGTARFTYVVADPAGLTSGAAVTIEVIPPTGSGPVAKDDVTTIHPGEVAVVPVLANDSHPDGLPFSLAGPPVVRAGTARVGSDGSIAFTPPDDTLTTYTLTYTIRDVYGRTSSADVTISVIAEAETNSPPAAIDDRAATAFQKATTIPVLANDADPDGDDIDLVSVARPSEGTATIDDGRVRYTPPNGFSGLASFRYTIEDEEGLRATATVIVEVSDRSTVAPLARPDLLVLVVGTSQVIDPRANDSDPDGSKSDLLISGLAPSAGQASVVAGGVRITAPSSPRTYTVQYTVTDPDGFTGSSQITVVAQPPPNQNPIAVNDGVITDYNTPVTVNVLGNDTDPDGGNIRVVSVGTPSGGGGTASVSSGGSAVTFTPKDGFEGRTTFGYTIEDSQGGRASASVTATVSDCSAPLPVLAPDSANTPYLTPIDLNLYVNDALTTGKFAVTQPNAGSAQVLGDGRVRYSPPANFNGNGVFSYTVTNMCGDAATELVTVDVNRPPTARNDAASTERGETVTIDVLANDSDPDQGDAPILDSVANNVGGEARITSGGRVRFTPTAAVGQPAGFTYTVRDDGGLTASASVVITLINRPPVARNDVAATDAGPVTIRVLDNDDDPDNDDLAVTGAQVTAGGGNASTNGTTVVYTPDSGCAREATVRYSITDGHGGNAQANIRIGIDRPNRNPIAAPDSASTFGGRVGVNVIANDVDPDCDELHLGSVVLVAGLGDVDVSGNSISFDPLVSFLGDAVIQYTALDGRGGSDVGTFTIQVGNRPPVAVNVNGGRLDPGESRGVQVIPPSSDPDGDPIFVVDADVIEGGGSASGGGSAVTYTAPNPYPGGTVRVRYTIQDSRGGSASAVVTFTVTASPPPPTTTTEPPPPPTPPEP